MNDYEQGQHDAYRHVAEALSLYAERLVECESKYRDSDHIRDLLGWAGIMQEYADSIAAKADVTAAFDEEGD